MGNLPLPDKHQPLDVKFFYSIVEEVNSLSAQAATVTNKYTNIMSPGITETQLLTGNVRMSAVFVDISKAGVNQGDRVEFTHQLRSGFKYPPIVTATCVTSTNSEVSRSAYSVLNSITTRLVKGEVVCSYSGDLQVYVNLIAVGVPE